MVKHSWMPVFMKAAKAVKEAIGPLVGDRSAAEILSIRPEGDVTRKIDMVADKAAIEVLMQDGESCYLLSEESGGQEFGRAKDGIVILDPLDGSANAARGIPAYSFSAAFATSEYLGGVREGFVFDLVNEVSYEAERRSGAKRNGKVMSPSKTEKLSESVIGVDLNIADLRVYLPKVIGVINMAKTKRHLGTNALELCFVASGAYDAFIDVRRIGRITDLAAACLVVKEAGGVVVDEAGVDFDAPLLSGSRLSFIAAANRKLCDNILANLKRSQKRK